MKYIVYQTVNKENGKLYIGVHKTENPEIFDGYIGNGVYIGYSLENPKTVYQHALKKYGYKSFIRTVLFAYDTVEEALKKEAELVTPEFVKQDNNYNTAVGGGYLIIYKSIYQFNNKKELVKTWEGNYSIAEYYGISINQIQYAIHNKKILLDSYFSYEENPDFDQYSKYKVFDLYQFSTDGTLIEVFKNTRECSEKLNLSFKSLETAITEKKKYKNCYWTHSQDNISHIIKLNKLYNLQNNPIQQFDKNHQLIQEYNSIKEAAEILGYKYDSIKAAARLGHLVDNQFYFKSTRQVSKNQKVGQYNVNTGELIKIWDSIAQCSKQHPKAREVVKGQRKQTHGYTFKYLDN